MFKSRAEMERRVEEFGWRGKPYRVVSPTAVVAHFHGSFMNLEPCRIEPA